MKSVRTLLFFKHTVIRKFSVCIIAKGYVSYVSELSSISVKGISTITIILPSSISILEVSSSSNGAFKNSRGTLVFLDIRSSSSSEGATTFIQHPVSILSSRVRKELFSLELLYI